jgi:hypothetical protein
MSICRALSCRAPVYAPVARRSSAVSLYLTSRPSARTTSHRPPNSETFVTQRQLLQEVWGPQYEKETNYLRVYLAQIRAKLEPDPSRPRYFITQARMGYRFECELRSEQQPLPRSES